MRLAGGAAGRFVAVVATVLDTARGDAVGVDVEDGVVNILATGRQRHEVLLGIA